MGNTTPAIAQLLKCADLQMTDEAFLSLPVSGKVFLWAKGFICE
jgi:hypothetical protein